MVYRNSRQFRKKPLRHVPLPIKCKTKRDFIDCLARRIRVAARHNVQVNVRHARDRDGNKPKDKKELPWDKNDCMRPSDFFTWARNQKKWKVQIKKYETKHGGLPKNAVVELTGLQITSSVGEDVYAMDSEKDKDLQKEVQRLRRENKKLREKADEN